MKRALKDGWFQMCAAIAGLAAVVSVIGGSVSRDRSPDPVPTSAPVADPFKVAAAQAPAAVPVAPPPGPVPAAPLITAPAAAAAPALAPAQPPDPAPKMTLTGTGVGNAQGIPGGAGGGIARFFGLGGVQVQPQAPAGQAIPTARYVTPAKKGVFIVDAAGGGDTTSLRDAAYSADLLDVIRVKPGTYAGPVEVVDKSITIRGEGTDPGAVTISHSGGSAAVVVRDGALELENIRVIYGNTLENPPSEPHGALYATGAVLILRKVELGSGSQNAPPLLVEKGAKSSRLTIEDSYFMGGRANAVIRGKVAAKFTRTRFDHAERPLVAWLDAAIEFADCDFKMSGWPVVNVYEGAVASVVAGQRPHMNGARGSEATGFEQLFGPSRKASARSGFSRDIFRAGRKAGQLP